MFTYTNSIKFRIKGWYNIHIYNRCIYLIAKLLRTSVGSRGGVGRPYDLFVILCFVDKTSS